MKHALRLLLPFLLITPLAAQQDSAVPSGPPAGMALKPIKVYAPVGERAGQEYDVAAAIGQAPAAILFLQTTDRGYIRQVISNVNELLKLADERAPIGFQAHVIQLVADRSTGETFFKSFGRIAAYQRAVLSLDGAEGPGDYALNRKCLATLVLCKDGKVVESRGMTQLLFVGARGRRLPSGFAGKNPYPALVAKVAPALPKDPAELRKVLLAKLPDDPATLKEHIVRLATQLQRSNKELSEARKNTEARSRGMRREGRRRGERGRGDRDMAAARKRIEEAVKAGKMTREEAGRRLRAMRGEGRGRRERGEGRRRGAAARGEGKAPDDRELGLLMRAIAKKSNSAEDNAALFNKLERRVGDDAGLRKQAVDMCKLIRKLNYGTDDARARAALYVKKHGVKNDGVEKHSGTRRKG